MRMLVFKVTDDFQSGWKTSWFISPWFKYDYFEATSAIWILTKAPFPPKKTQWEKHPTQVRRLCQRAHQTSCLNTWRIWRWKVCFCWNVGAALANRKVKRLRLRQTELLYFYSLYLHTANGAARHICPLHYLLHAFIRAILTCVPSDRWQSSFFIFLYEPCRVAEVGHRPGAFPKWEKKINIMMGLWFFTAFVWIISNREDLRWKMCQNWRFKVIILGERQLERCVFDVSEVNTKCKYDSYYS